MAIVEQHSKVRSKLIALFGGTFDPIHNGHLQTVNALKEDLQIDEVRWVVSAKPPHRGEPSATPEQRIEMLELALEPYSNMICDDIELKRDGPSYTVLTLEAYRQQFPDDHIILIVGADVMQSFHTWHQHEKITQLAHMIVMHRPGYKNALAAVLKPFETKQADDFKKAKNGKVLVYPAPAVPISATAIREKLLNHEVVDGLVPDLAPDLAPDLVPSKVADYINAQKLYRSVDENTVYS